MCFGTTNCEVEIRSDELRVDRLEVDDDLVRAGGLDRLDVRVGSHEADQVHRLVLLAGREAVGDVGGGERLAVAPLRVLDEVERERLVAVAPLPALREPRIGVAAAGDAADDERLVERATDEGAAGQARGGIGVEVLDEGGVARAGHDEAAVPGLCGGDAEVGGGRRSGREERGERGETGDRGHPCEPAVEANVTSHRAVPFLPGGGGRGATVCRSGNVSGGCYHAETRGVKLSM